MSKIINYIRSRLAQRELELHRIATPRLRFEDFISRRTRTTYTIEPASVHVFDDDPRLQSELIKAFGTARVCFHTFSFLSSEQTPTLFEPEIQAAGRFWVILNSERCPLRKLLQNKLWAKSADTLIIRSSFAALSTCPDGFVDMMNQCEQLGLFLYDVSISVQPVIPNATNSRMLLLFSRRNLKKESAQDKADRIERLDEAHAFFAKPVAQQSQFHWLTGRGSFGFEAGVFNPGAISENGSVYLLARGEKVPWPLQERSEMRHFSGWKPLLIRLGDSTDIVSHVGLQFTGSLDQSRIRLEDFRLFKYRDQIVSNHSVITPPEGRAPREQPVQLALQRARVGLSTVALNENTLNFVGFPKLDFPTRDIEKNWGMMAVGDELYLIYSISPYRILRLTRWNELEFKTEISRNLDLPFAQGRQLVRNSINPVSYDEHHFLHLVHKVYPSKQYVFWAMLIDKRTMCPTFVSNRPIVRSGDSLPAAILYACSAIAHQDRISLFGGINDCGAGTWMIDRADLDRTWQSLGKHPNA